MNTEGEKRLPFGISQERRDKAREMMASKNMATMPDSTNRELNKQKAKELKEFLGY